LRSINWPHPFVLAAFSSSSYEMETSAFATAHNAPSGEGPACFRDDGPRRFAAAIRMEIENDPILFLAESGAQAILENSAVKCQSS